ncbi:phosphoribosyl-AMP cyclohydrolase [Sneathiella sp. P13V-1]|uniref:phosphoribosyl-AMP cyclohydrolase n=1 Tax=Sneathiella sp. P13V-1 TaxID=2697366 RepID=UPI001D0FFEBE|nr:phosphoribosyl-AMP cyclohydrolase [Sneathiella sp. P13V-1]MBE7637040.1 phosphoribosyl-AMP cyclohydrolase [Sneathiella sp. P13V-1]
MNSELEKLLKLNADGLIPAIAQQHDTGEVLMMAWMNKDAIEETLKTGRVCYWSRSRQSLWRKGETSGNSQRLISFRLDCDGDTILVLVDQEGAACHTGRRNCFFYEPKDAGVEIISAPIMSKEEMYGKK